MRSATGAATDRGGKRPPGYYIRVPGQWSWLLHESRFHPTSRRFPKESAPRSIRNGQHRTSPGAVHQRESPAALQATYRQETRPRSGYERWGRPVVGLPAWRVTDHGARA